MSGINLTETDPTMQLYEARAIIIELKEEIQRMKQENERLWIENNRNRHELVLKVSKLENNKSDSINCLTSLELQMEELMKALNLNVNQINQRLEALGANVNKIAVSNAENLQLKEQMTALELNVSKNENLSDRFKTLELTVNKIRSQEDLSQKMRRIEEDLAVSNAENLQLKEQMAGVQSHFNQKVTRLEQGLAAAENINFDRISSLEFQFKEQLNKQHILMDCVQNQPEEQGVQKNASVLILGGNGPLNTIYLLDSKAQSWKKLSITLPMGLFGFGAVALNEEIYIFGGYAKHCYKLKNDGTWTRLAPLNQKRYAISSSSLVYKGDIWVIGGIAKEFLKSVEKYDVSQDKWTNMPEMNYARREAAAAVCKDRIFISGGWNGEKLKSVEMFDPLLQKWIIFCDLPFELSGHTILINNSILSIFGGDSASGKLNSVWEMNIEDPEKKWIDKTAFKHLRFHFGIAKLSNQTIIFGNYRNSANTSEIFDGNKWIDGPMLPQYLSDFAYTSIPQSLESFLYKFI